MEPLTLVVLEVLMLPLVGLEGWEVVMEPLTLVVLER